jgi:hypothetical protein
MVHARHVALSDLCPCGSGKFYHDCCWEVRLEVWDDHVKTVSQEMQRRRNYGDIRLIVHATFQGKKMVAVSDQLFCGEWKFFPDFLRFYLPQVLTTEWVRAENCKSLAQRHPIMKWWQGMNEYLKTINQAQGQINGFQPDGATLAVMLLAYDLYVLRHHQALQAEVLRRLKQHTSFQGARHELFVAATCIRAGCKLDYEDETDRSRGHVEFHATHRASGAVFSVEAKSRHDEPGKKSARRRVGGLVNAALAKPRCHPFVIFVDVNAPAEHGPLIERHWFQAAKRSLDAAGSVKTDRDAFNLIVFTNHPFFSGGPPVPPPESISLVGKDPQYPMDESVVTAIQQATEQFGIVPMHFLDD